MKTNRFFNFVIILAILFSPLVPGFWVHAMGQGTAKHRSTLSVQGKDFNKNHPELISDEVFITNISTYDIYTKGMFVYNPSALMINFTEISWKTKRLGMTAYDIYGKPIKKMRPVFVKKTEIEKDKEGRKFLKDLLP